MSHDPHDGQPLAAPSGERRKKMETRGVVSAGRMPHTQSPGALLGEDNEFTAKATPESGGSWIERSPGVALTGAIRAALTSVRMRKRAVSRCERWKVGGLSVILSRNGHNESHRAHQDCIKGARRRGSFSFAPPTSPVQSGDRSTLEVSGVACVRVRTASRRPSCGLHLSIRSL
jgi:hypothetical protein